jgi:hypothetical protein
LTQEATQYIHHLPDYLRVLGVTAVIGATNMIANFGH